MWVNEGSVALSSLIPKIEIMRALKHIIETIILKPIPENCVYTSLETNGEARTLIWNQRITFRAVMFEINTLFFFCHFLCRFQFPCNLYVCKLHLVSSPQGLCTQLPLP